ncbi:UDP-glucose 4-epimerase [Amycolatopsis marina]|uniref:UDP-glucose 4-epimerase n=1 Tax=Amycolatopsis marina TaxID=490629 RepID=A0A1I1CV14_9PSEU|nr:NAD(P)-dependent oxidoreductase [Amycolatopsis marina]SFB64748.1 UDP-glucose 4-epimerase [Amycolatopsis marina]
MSEAAQSGRTVLVTGAAGLIGVPVVRQLRRAGFRVIAVDNGSAGTLHRLGEFAGCRDVAIRVADIRHRAELTAVMATERPWGVLHLAARHFIPDCERSPGQTLEVNVLGTQNLIDACAQVPPRRLVFASTADVYRPDCDPHGEDGPVGPCGVYGCSKLLGETLFRDQGYRLDGTEVMIGRLFNVYGPGDPHPHLLPEVLRQLRRGPVLRLGDLEAARDFVYVDDAAEALLALLTIGPPGVVNVGTGSAVRGRELVRIVAELTAQPIDVQLDRGRLRRQVRPTLCAAPGRVLELVPGWPRIPLLEGIRRTIHADRGHDLDSRETRERRAS